MAQDGESRLKKRQVTLKDGRYLIFYTFEDESAPFSKSDEAKRRERKPQTEKRHV